MLQLAQWVDEKVKKSPQKSVQKLQKKVVKNIQSFGLS
jgi:hypothetical protein